MMDDQLIRAQASAAEIACGQISPAWLAALRDSFEEACRLRAEAGWESKAAAHAAFFTILAEAAGDPAAAAMLLSGGEVALELMITAGRGCDGIVVNSRRRFLEHLRGGDPGGAALELEDHLRILRVMCRLAGRGGRAPARDAVLTSVAQALIPAADR
ncbi:MAG TPA: FCD domain-containing protein [Trebonia sp.]